MNFPTEMTIRPNEHREEGEMHLLDADAREEDALCGADTSADCRANLGR